MEKKTMKISIIILSFNNFDETTGQCLNYLAADPDFPNWEIIVVDNASDVATQQKLNEVRLRHPNLTLILNSSNLGFSAGNNVGIHAASGDHLILLNSDAFPPPGMINRLVEHLKADARLGMIGPVTNAAGNEQCIFTSSSDIHGKIAEGLQYALGGNNATLSVYRLDFFCVLIPRAVLDRVGLLDESFGRGYFEDLDYSLRVKKAGFRLGLAEDCFVYHRGSTSFRKLPKEVKALLKKNKRLVLKKHGDGVLFQHKRLANLALLSQYVERKRNGENVPECRIRNRVDLAMSELPKSWLKRWLYLRNVRHTIAQIQAIASSENN